MIKNIIRTFILFACLHTAIFAQTEDPVLFTVAETDVHVSEFDYIYKKTNGAKADYSQASIDEYLDLYMKFKLKVERARSLNLDTIPGLKKELAGYRRQLANTYLLDKEITEKLIKEAYERSKEDIDISHILIAMPQNPSDAGVASALRRADYLYNQLATKSFEEVVKEGSNDPNAKRNKGHLGYFTALQLPGFYNIETAAYNTEKGKYSRPVRSDMGFHIIRVNDRRPARGEIKAAHILIRVDGTEAEQEAAAEKKINEIHKKLNKDNFEALASQFSHDKSSAKKGGAIGWFGINKYEASIEDVAFSLRKNGEYSKPFRSSVGYHIIKRLDHRGVQEYDKVKPDLTTKVKRDSRFQLAQDAMVERIKKEANYTENKEVREEFNASLDKTFKTYQWLAPKEGGDAVLFSLGKQEFKLGDFTEYLKRSGGLRQREGKNNEPAAISETLYKAYVQQSSLKYEESQLENKYPEFRSLMREYEEGILLFEATKLLVWDKASTDEEGLKEFHGNNAKKYVWEERAVVSDYTIKTSNPAIIAKARKLALKKPAAKVMAKLNKAEEVVTVRESNIEKTKADRLAGLAWLPGAMSDSKVENNITSFKKIERIASPEPKSLDQARGYVVADYQDYLEKQWVKELEDMYPVKVNNNVLKSLIKK